MNDVNSSKDENNADVRCLLLWKYVNTVKNKVAAKQMTSPPRHSCDTGQNPQTEKRRKTTFFNPSAFTDTHLGKVQPQSRGASQTFTNNRIIFRNSESCVYCILYPGYNINYPFVFNLSSLNANKNRLTSPYSYFFVFFVLFFSVKSVPQGESIRNINSAL